MHLKNEENVFETEIRTARAQGKKVYILGAALGAVRIAGGLDYRGLDFDGFIVDPDYYQEGGILLGKRIYCVDEVVGDDCIVLKSIANYPRLEALKSRVKVIDEDVLSLSMVASDPLDMDFVKTHMREFDTFYDSLQDDKSRRVMDAYINQKITGRFSEMAGLWDEVQYFDEDFYDLAHVGCIVDCGAFIGDSFLSFCGQYRRCAGKEYEGKAYLLDPDEYNQRQIAENCKSVKADVSALKIGAWYKPDTLTFQLDESQRTAGKISESGDTSISVDAIDNILRGRRADFIKMDIEGAELNALKGAEQTIKRDKPILAICVYHKREDLLEIPAYISSVYGGYKFYLRAYGGPYSIELVLYAIDV